MRTLLAATSSLFLLLGTSASGLQAQATEGGHGEALPENPRTTGVSAAALSAEAEVQGAITGQVVAAESGQPLSSVQVSLPDLEIGTLTNEQGRFRIEDVPTGQHELRAQRLGYAATTRTVDVAEGQAVEVNITLEQRAISMEGIVVTGVAGETPQSQVPFSVGNLPANEMQQVSQPSPGRMLQGRMSGVKVIQGSGQPGSESSIQLRGPTSITGSQEPLIVVDGVITGGSMADINSEDIASIEVIKGAAAAALFGSRAQAGVIQITTHRGAEQGDDVSFTLRSTVESHDIEHYLGVNGGNIWRTDDQGNFLDLDGNPVELPAEGGQLALDDGADGQQARSTFADDEYPPPTFDPMRQLFDPGNRYQFHASASGNLDATRFYVSGAYESEQGPVTLNPAMEQYQGRVNLTQEIGEDFTVTATSYVSDRTRPLMEEQGGLLIDLTWTSQKANLLQPCETCKGGISFVGDPISIGNVDENPVHRLVNTTHEEDRTRILAGAQVDWEPNSWLTITGDASYDRADESRLFYERPGLQNLFDQPPTEGDIERTGNLNEDFNGSVTVASNRTIGDDLTMRNRIRWLVESSTRSTFLAEGSELAVDQTPRLGVVTGTPEIDSSLEEVRSEGFFLINQATYKDRYVLDFLVRRDGSSLFGEDERWQNYGRLSGAWRVSQEPWFDIGFLSEFKPRYSIGTSGGRPSFSHQYQTYSVERGSIVPTTLGNDELKPELATEQEFGLDAVIAERIQFTVNYVDTKVEDQLLRVPLAAKQGFEAQWQNAGTLESNTWEVSVEGAIIDQPDVRWTMGVNADRTDNEITELNVPSYEVTNPGLSRARQMVREGETLGSFYGFQWLGSCDEFAADMPCDQFDVNDLGHLVWVGEGNTWRDGVDQDLWGTVGQVNGREFQWGHPIRPASDNPLNFTKIGESQPELNLSVSQNFQWGDFGLTTLLTGEWGAQIYNFSQQWQCRDWHCAIADMRGVPDGEKKPVTYFNELQQANEANSFFAEDADFVKLRELSVRYTLDDGLLPAAVRNIGVQEATINLTGRNLKTWTDYRGFDPEVGTDSFGGSAVVGRVDEWFVPNFRSVGVDVSIVF